MQVKFSRLQKFCHPQSTLAFFRKICLRAESVTSTRQDNSESVFITSAEKIQQRENIIIIELIMPSRVTLRPWKNLTSSSWRDKKEAILM